jgi:hypothetical protein
VYLAEWNLLPEDFDVYHIISPATGGKDHPANYVMLPNYFPTDYHIEGKATLHHVLMLQLLGKTKVPVLLDLGKAVLGAAPPSPPPQKNTRARAQTHTHTHVSEMPLDGPHQFIDERCSLTWCRWRTRSGRGSKARPMSRSLRSAMGRSKKQ